MSVYRTIGPLVFFFAILPHYILCSIYVTALVSGTTFFDDFTITHLCNVQSLFSSKNLNFHWKKLIFLIILLKTLIVGTCSNCFAEVVLTSIHNVCFGSIKRKHDIFIYPCAPKFYYIKVGYKEVYITWPCFPDVMMSNSIVRDARKPVFGVSDQVSGLTQTGLYIHRRKLES